MTTTLGATVARSHRWQRIRPPVLLAAGLLGASVLLHLRDPHASGSWGYCPWLLLTGTQCPGCGGLRAVNDLTHGDLVGAASSNLLLVGSLPLVGLLWVRSLRDRWRGVSRSVDTRWALVLSALALVLVTGFWVLRNLPVGAWLLA